MTVRGRDINLMIEMPVGYAQLPLIDIDDSIAAAAGLLSEIERPDVTLAADQILPALGSFLHELGMNNVRYCGIGRHSHGDAVVTSVLTIIVYDTGGDSESPRLVVKNLAETKAEGGVPGDLQVIDLDNRPMMFFEHVDKLPVPDFPGNPTDGAATPIYQLEAVVPSADGSAVAAIELSTMFTAHGPRYRRMVVDMARSIDFQIRETHGSLLNL